MLQLHTLGGLWLEVPEGSLGGAAAQRKTLALLAILAVAGPRGISRDKLVGYLWPDSLDEKATHRLTQLLYRLRRDLKADDLFLGTTSLHLNPAAIATDLAQLTRALETGDFAGAVHCYGGPFLDGFYLDDAPEFERWAEEERGRLARHWAGALELLAQDAKQRGDHATVAGCLRQLTQADPLNARVAVRYIEALALTGDRAGALRFAETYEAMLRADYDAEPDPALLEAAERVRSAPTGEQLPVAALPPAVAVLPFANLTPDRDNEYFSDGMTEELTSALARIPGLRVASRISAFAFKGKNTDAREIAHQLGVSVLIGGSVRKVGDRIRITAQLVSGTDGCHIWSQTYDRTLDDVFSLQEEISQAIVAALPLGGGPVKPLVRPPTSVVDAYTLYLRGRYAALKRNVEGLTLGIEYFEQALEKDPDYVLAYAGLAECWALSGFGEFGELDPKVAMPRARAAVQEALRLDPRLPQAHNWLGVIHLLFDWDWAAAEAEFRRAVQLQPDYAYAQVWYAILLAQLHRFEESLRRIRLAEALDPLSPTVRLSVGRCYYFARRYPEALECFQTLWRADPGDRLIAMWLGRALACMGRHGEAVEELGKATASGSQRAALDSLRALVLFGAGRREEALAMCRALQSEAAQDSALCTATAIMLPAALIQLGEADAAFEILEKGVEARSAFIPFIGDPIAADWLRADLRFGQLLVRLGLPASTT